MKNFRLYCCITALMFLWSVSAKTTLVILNDTHVSPGTPAQTALEQIIDEISLMSPDAVIVNGDLTNEGSDAELANIKKILDRIPHATYIVPGNHENNWSQSAGFTYLKLWDNDRFSGVVGPDSLIIVGTNCGPYMKMGDGHVKQEDLHWLKSTLDSLTASNPNSKVLSFNHYGLNPDMDNYLDYIATIKDFPVVAHINGHYHQNFLYDLEGCADMKGITLTSIHRGKGNYGYCIVEIDDDSVKVFNKNLGKDSLEILQAIKTPEKLKFKKMPSDWNVKKVWADSASIFTRPAIDGVNVIFGTSNGYVKSIDIESGNQNWTYNIGSSVYSRPVVTNTSIIVPTINGGLVWLDKKTGKKLKELADSLPYVADGILSDDGKVLYQGGYGKLMAISPDNGNVIWINDEIENYCQGEPALVGNKLVFGAWDSYLRCIEPDTGKLRWKWNNGKKSNMLGPGNVVPIITDDKVVIVAPDRYMTMINLADGSTIWRDNSVKYRESLGSNADNTVAYAKTMDGELIAVDITKDEFSPIWKTDMNIGYEHAPCPVLVSDGRIFTGSRRGIINVLNEENGELQANIIIGKSEVNGLAPVVDLKHGKVSPVVASLVEGTIYLITPN